MHPAFRILSLASIERRTNLLDGIYEHWEEYTAGFARSGSFAIDIWRTDDCCFQTLGSSCKDQFVDIAMRSTVGKRSYGCNVLDIAPDLGILMAVILGRFQI